MRGEGRATEEGGETGEGQRKEKTTSDDKVVTPVAQRSWVPGPWDRAGLRRGVGSSEKLAQPLPGSAPGRWAPSSGHARARRSLCPVCHQGQANDTNTESPSVRFPVAPEPDLGVSLSRPPSQSLVFAIGS